MTGAYIFLALFVLTLLAMLCFSKNNGYPEELISSKEYIFKYYYTLNSRKTSYDFPLIFLDDWKTEDLEVDKTYILSLTLPGNTNIRDYLFHEVWKGYTDYVIRMEVYENIYHTGSDEGTYSTSVLIGKYQISGDQILSCLD